jgi:hypothetical protein
MLSVINRAAHNFWRLVVWFALIVTKQAIPIVTCCLSQLRPTFGLAPFGKSVVRARGPSSEGLSQKVDF